jgi:hypothetical protein
MWNYYAGDCTDVMVKILTGAVGYLSFDFAAKVEVCWKWYLLIE